MQRAGRIVAPRPRKPCSRRQVGPGPGRGSALSGRILGAVLAGGRSSRFGSDKAIALWRGRTLIDWAIDAVTPFCAAVAVVGRDWTGLVRIEDKPRPGLGPLGGIAGALDYAKNNGFDSILTIACDMPEVPVAVLAELVTDVPTYCPDAPVLGHWPIGLAYDLLSHLQSVVPAAAGASGLGQPVAVAARSAGRRRGDGMLSVRRWAEGIDARHIPAPDLRNVNRPTDLAP